MINLTIAGQVYPYPTLADEGWGGAATDWAQAVSTQLLQRTGGTFTLTGEVNFGATFATAQAYLKSRTANIATAEFIRMARADSIAWRNAANNANLLLSVDADNNLTFDGSILLAVASALTANRALISSAGGDITVSSVTNTELGYLSGVTSALQTQLDAKQALATILTAIAALGTNGIITRTASGTVSARTVTGTSNRITVTNGDGVSGNPTLDIGTDVVTLTGTQSLTNKTVSGLKTGVNAKTTTYTTVATDTTVPCDATGGAFSVTLITAVGNEGLIQTIKKVDSSANAVTVVGTIDGATNPGLFAQNDSITVQSNNVAWIIIGQKLEKQFVIGTAQTVNGARDNSSYGTPTNAPAVTITARRTGNYRIAGSITVGPSGVSDCGAQLVATSGSPTVVQSQTVGFGQLTTGGTYHNVAPYTIVTLTAGSSYTFTLQTKNSGAAVVLFNSLFNSVLTAQEL